MSDRTSVSVVEFSDRKFYMLQWLDPVTGRKRTLSSKVERTGRKRERTEAERRAAKLEAELREGRHNEPAKMTWGKFRDRYEAEVLPGLSQETATKVNTTFGLVENILQPNRLQEMTTEAVSKWVAALQEDRADTTVGIYCRHLKASLRWAEDMGFILKAPKIRIPRRATGKRLMKGRPIVREEHERLLAAVGKVVNGPYAPRWRHFLEGLWWSGLRVGEAVRLSWEPAEAVSIIMQPGYHPALQFRAEGQKAGRGELTPIAPEFAEFLKTIPKEERHGFVFDLQIGTTARLSTKRVSRIVAEIGRAARVIVDESTGKAASAHDYRRAFGTRWAKRIMPAVLKVLMRHKDIQTTLRYYVDQDAEDIASDLWAAYRKEIGNRTSNTRPEIPCL